MMSPRPRVRGAAPARTGLLCLAIGVLAGCSLDVETPTIVEPGTLGDSTALSTLRAGAIGDFAVAFAGDPEFGEEGAILAGGMRADEFLNRDTFVGRRDIDVGVALPENGQLPDVFRNLHRARRSAEFAAQQYGTLAPVASGHAEVLNLVGYSTVLLGETFCPGIPFSSIDAAGRIQPGEPLALSAIMARAGASFTSAEQVATQAAAAAAAAEDAEAQAAAEAQRDLARLGRARALMNLGTTAGITQAAALVAEVPTEFRYEVRYSENTPRQNNGVFTFNVNDRRFGVADLEGGNGMPFVSAADPRVPTSQSDQRGLDAEDTTLFNQEVFPSRESSIPLATGVEARLIEAEAALVSGNAGQLLAILNVLRTTVPGLAPIPAATRSPREQAELLFRERAFWLFATAHRLGDLRRLLRPPYSEAPYAFAGAEIYPVGPYFKGGRTYVVQPSLPIPLEETNNPRFQSCLASN